MTCDEVRRQLDAWLDEALEAKDQSQVEAHLAECGACRMLSQDLRRQDETLRRAFAPRRRAAGTIAERVLAILRAEATPGRPWRSAFLALAAAAAGFLLALVFMRPEPSPARPFGEKSLAKATAPKPEESLQLVVATGAVEVCNDNNWEAMPTGGLVAIGCSVRTPPKVRCEFRTPDGSEVRLNESTEVCFKSPREVNLKEGRVWSTVQKAPTPFCVVSPTVKVTALGTQFDFLHRAKESKVTVVEGKTLILCNNKKTEVPAGNIWSVDAKDHAELERQPAYELLKATDWVNEILMLKGHGNPELTKRIDDLFAHIGETKSDILNDDEIRLLGDHCVLPLTRYLQSDRSKGQIYKRRQAASILADLAQPWCIRDLIGLLEDKDPQVRVSAATALKRLTNQSFGMQPTEWQSAQPAACTSAQATWQEWLKNKDFRCPSEPPGATRGVTAKPAESKPITSKPAIK